MNSYVVSNDNLAPGETPSNLLADAAASNSAFVNGFRSGQTFAQIQAATSQINGAMFFPPGITVPDGSARAPQFQKWSLELQQALGGALRLIWATSVITVYAGWYRTLVRMPGVLARLLLAVVPTRFPTARRIRDTAK